MPPPVPLAIEKQRTLCLGPRHQTCATFQAATEQREAAESGAEPAAVSADERVSASFWPAVRTSPVLLEPARSTWRSLSNGRGPVGQVLLVGLMLVAFAVLVVARGTGPARDPVGSPSPTSAAATASAGPATPLGTPGQSPAASPGPTITPEASPSPRSSATTRPSPTAEPDVRRYTVRAGDTLSGIAAQFGTTVDAVAELNGITNPSLIRVGQVLLIP